MTSSVNENTQASVERVRQEVERWIDVARTAGERTLEAIGLSPMTRCSLPAVDVLETCETIQVWVDVPGLPAEAVQLTTTDNKLTIRLSRTTVGEVPGHYALRERPHACCERTILLPASVHPDKTTAQLKDGVLHVTLPKQNVSTARTVPVNAVM